MLDDALRFLGNRIESPIGLEQRTLAEICSTQELECLREYITQRAQKLRALETELRSLVYDRVSVPTVDRVRFFFGQEAAEAFAVLLHHSGIVQGNPTLDCAATESGMLLLKWFVRGDHEAFRVFKKEQSRRRKQNITDKTIRLRQRADALCIWFPYPDQRNLWKTNYELFVILEEQVRQVMKEKDKGVMQFIQKRKFTGNNVKELDLNLENMKRYLLDKGG